MAGNVQRMDTDITALRTEYKALSGIVTQLRRSASPAPNRVPTPASSGPASVGPGPSASVYGSGAPPRGQYAGTRDDSVPSII